MEKINFATTINAPREKVWKVLWDDASYRNWTSVFTEGSYAKTDNWKEGSKVLFLSPEGDGMVSKVASNKPNKFMSFEHLGVVKNGVEDTESESVKGCRPREHRRVQRLFYKNIPGSIGKSKRTGRKKLNNFIKLKTTFHAKDNSISLV